MPTVGERRMPSRVLLQRMGRVGRHRPNLIPDVLIIEPAADAEGGGAMSARRDVARH